MTAEPLLTAYLRVLEAHGWVQVPTRETSIAIFVRGTHLLDRIEVVRGRWSHHHFDGSFWLTHEKGRGDDAASLERYLAQHFRSAVRGRERHRGPAG